MEKPLYQAIAQTLNAYQTCVRLNKSEWINNHETRLEELANSLPHGSGFDHTPSIMTEKGDGDTKFYVYGAYHCMNENGMYDGWINFTVKVTANMIGDYDVSCVLHGDIPKRYRDMKDYICEAYHYALEQIVK